MYLQLGVPDNPSAAVNLAANSQWVGGFTINAGDCLVVKGGLHVALITGSLPSSFFVGVSGGNPVVDVAITGNSVLQDDGTLEIGDSVDRGIMLNAARRLRIDHPNQFLGSVQFSSGEIDLESLAKADSYTYQNDMLSIFSGKSVIDTLRLADLTPHGFVVEKTSGSVNILAITDPTNPPVGLPIYMSQLI